MSKKIGGVFALMGLCALSLFLINCGNSSSRPSGLLYVLTQGNNGIGNNVTSFAIDLGTGYLSLINANASTCTTMTASCGAPLEIVLDPIGATAFVLNQGVPSASVPPTIYGYNINSDGSFGAPTVAAPLATGDLPMAMARDATGQFLFVLDLGSTSTPQNCPPPGTLNPGNPIYAGCSSISVFAMTPGSATLTLVSQFSAAQTPYYLGRFPTALSVITFTPPGSATSQELLFVTSNYDPIMNNDNTVSVYSVSPTGILTEQANSPYATNTDPISVQVVNTNQAGTGTGGVFVYVGSQPTAAGALEIFDLCTVVDANCKPSDVASSLLRPVNATAPPSVGQNPVAMLVDPTNTFLYVVCEGTSQVYGYKVSTAGTLSILSPPYMPTGSRPVSMAMHPTFDGTGEFLYTSNNAASNISGFSLSTITGSMINPFTVDTLSTPTGLAAR